MLSDPKEWIDTIGKVAVPVLLFVFGYILVNSVENALEQKKLEVESASAIKELLTTLHGEVGQSEANAAALTLAAYGEAAIIPLIGTIEYGSPQTEAAAQRALFMIGLQHPEKVTETLSNVLSKRHGQFHAHAHQIAIVVLGAVGHKDADNALLDYRFVMERTAPEGIGNWETIVRGAKIENYKETQVDLKRALASLDIEWSPSQ